VTGGVCDEISNFASGIFADIVCFEFIEVSWMVTGIRQDVFAEDAGFVVESVKDEDKQGLYMHPEPYGYGMEKSLNKENLKGLKDEELINE
jgi:hypothetical protein